MFWTKTMESGIAILDEHHKELFRQVDYLLNSDKPERVQDTLGFLKEYVVQHFATEEMLHAKTGYPKAKIHKKMHDDFTAAFLSLKNEYSSSGYNLVTLLKLNRTAVAWLKEHVMGADMEFAEHYKKFLAVS